MLDLMKLLLNISDSSKDAILNHYITKATNSVRRYLNINDTDDITAYSDSTVDLAIIYYRNRDKEGVVQIAQGSRSMTKIDGIPQSIKNTLPYPRIRML